MKGKAVRTPDSLCPKCGEHLNAASAVVGPKRTPKVGDLTVCIRCGVILVFGDDLKPRAMLPTELVEMLGTEAWNEALRAQEYIVHQNAFGQTTGRTH